MARHLPPHDDGRMQLFMESARLPSAAERSGNCEWRAPLVTAGCRACAAVAAGGIPAGALMHAGQGDSVLRGEQLHIEFERGIGWNHSANAVHAIAKRRRNDEPAAAASLHARHAFVPAGDHHALA